MYPKKRKQNIILAILFLITILTCAVLYILGGRSVFSAFKTKITKYNNLRKEETLKFGFVTDIHCYAKENKKTNNWDLNWRCEEPLEHFVEKMNSDFKPDFVVEGGDFIDGRDDRAIDDFIELGEIYQQLEMPAYHVLGNHETRSFSKTKWLDLTGYEKPYYFFDIKNYRAIVLDGNYKLTMDGSIVDTSKEVEYYPAYFDQKQIDWLEDTLKEAEGREKLVFVHQPLISDTIGRDPSEFSPLAPKLRKIFSDYGVKAVFSGHIEEFCAIEDGGVQYYVLQGFHKNNERLKTDAQFKDAGVFSEVEIGDEVKVTVYHINENIKDEEDGDERDLVYASFELNQSTTPCNNSVIQ